MIKKNSNIIVKKSKISGRGIYAKRDIKKGEAVYTVRGKIHTFHPDDDSWSMQNAVGYEKNKWLNPDPDNALRFTNHSCEPNSILARGMKVIALRDIKKDEEITIDYSFTEGDSGSEMGRCYCKSKGCRKEIKSIHHIQKSKLLKYKKYLPRWITESYNEIKKKKQVK